jgi:hypothetical protein
MRIDLTPEQRAFRDELREYFTGIMTPELFAEIRGTEGGGPLYTAALRKMGRDGYLGMSWPRQYGGQERTPIEQFIFANEVQSAGFPLPFLTLNTVGPSIMRFGSEEQKAYFLPRILRGELQFAIGYSEPGAGTDLASLTTRAVRDGDPRQPSESDEWVINGQKVFTSLASFADYIWLAARTDPSAKKHRGISIFAVPTSSPGYKITPIQTMGGVRTNATYYEDVRVPASSLIGGENEGWGLITNQLNHERLSLVTPGPVERMLREVVDWARATKLSDGRKVIDQPWVRQNLARVHTRLEVLRLMCWKQAWSMQAKSLQMADASTVKVFGSESFVEIYDLLMEVIGPESALEHGSPGEVLRGRLAMMFRTTLILTFGGGTNEVQRDIIAMAGLGLPHYKS